MLFTVYVAPVVQLSSSVYALHCTCRPCSAAVIFSVCSSLSMSLASYKRRPFNADFYRRNIVLCQEILEKTDRFAGALSCREKRHFLYFSGCFLLTASLRLRKMAVYTSLFTAEISRKLYHRIPETLKILCTILWHS